MPLTAVGRAISASEKGVRDIRWCPLARAVIGQLPLEANSNHGVGHQTGVNIESEMRKFGIPSLPPSCSMDLLAVPKKKVSPYKKGLRNGPKALKPISAIMRCKACGRVKLPHFFCCSGERGTSEGTEPNEVKKKDFECAS